MYQRTSKRELLLKHSRNIFSRLKKNISTIFTSTFSLPLYCTNLFPFTRFQDTGSSDRFRDSNRQAVNSEGNRESSEITYGFTVDSVPPDFQTADKSDSEEEEESFVHEEIVEYLPAQPGVLEMGSPRRIPDLDSPKEHHSLTIPVHHVEKEEDTKDEEQEADEQVGEKFETEDTKEPEKEEFVISLDELSNVDFSAMVPEEQNKPKKEVDVPRVNYRIEFLSSLNAEQERYERENVHEEPVYCDEDNVDGTDEMDSSVVNKCSELSFTPNSEGEAEHLLEEKSISMIAVPAERTPVKNSLSTEETADTKGSNSSRSSSVEESPRSDDTSDSASNLTQIQYQQLQQQFAMWQNQLLQNQKQLANSDTADVTANQAGPEDQSNLQLQQLHLQIQMQQQMMLQLQQSMQTLALQTTLVSPQPPQVPTPLPTEPVPKFTSTPAPTVSRPPPAPEPPIVPAPPATQVAASKPKPSKADAKYTKPKQKRFERQLDPREQLMLDIRNFGKTHLKKVRMKKV